MRGFSKFIALALCGGVGVLFSERAAFANADLDQMLKRWQKLHERVEALDVPSPHLTKIIYHKKPFPYVEALDLGQQAGRLPIRGVAFDLPRQRIVIIQNLFDTAGSSLSDFSKLQFAKMLRSLLPRRALQRAFEIEVRGFTDIQTFGDPLNLKECDIKKPRNNACLGKARAANTTDILKTYIQQTLGSPLPLIEKYDPDPLMHNLNLQSDGKVWLATGAEENARKIAQLFVFEPRLERALSVQDILSIRTKAAKKAKRLRSEIEALLQPFRCAIVIAWRS